MSSGFDDLLEVLGVDASEVNLNDADQVMRRAAKYIAELERFRELALRLITDTDKSYAIAQLESLALQKGEKG